VSTFLVVVFRDMTLRGLEGEYLSFRGTGFVAREG